MGDRGKCSWVANPVFTGGEGLEPAELENVTASSIYVRPVPAKKPTRKTRKSSNRPQTAPSSQPPWNPQTTPEPATHAGTHDRNPQTTPEPGTRNLPAATRDPQSAIPTRHYPRSGCNSCLRRSSMRCWPPDTSRYSAKWAVPNRCRSRNSRCASGSRSASSHAFRWSSSEKYS